MLLPLGVWVPVVDGGDRLATAMYERHYSSGRSLARRLERDTPFILGPGRKMLLMTPCRRALFGWRLARHRQDGLVGVECAIFRNEGAGRSSDLIRAADSIADARWPGMMHFTYVDPVATAAHRTAGAKPGHCFRRAGWKSTDRVSGRGLVVLVRPGRRGEDGPAAGGSYDLGFGGSGINRGSAL